MREAARKTFRDYGVAILAAVAVALFIRFFVVEAYRIPTAAMRPALEPGDTVFVAKKPFGFGGRPDRGDIVVFETAADPGREFIKRVIGLPGDTVLVRKGRVTLNGKPLSDADPVRSGTCAPERLPESGRAHEACWEPPLNEEFGPQKVPEGSVFVIGDLRGQGSVDARRRRSWGIIPLSAVRGRARWTWLSVEPSQNGASLLRLPSFRFNRMLRRID